MATPTAEITRPPVPPRTAPPWTRQGIGLIALVVVTNLDDATFRAAAAAVDARLN